MEADVPVNDSYLSGAGWVIVVWWLMAFVAWVCIIPEVVERRVLLIILMCASASASPLYGYFLYSRARRRGQRRRARGAGWTAGLLFVVGTGFGLFIYMVLKAMSGLR